MVNGAVKGITILFTSRATASEKELIGGYYYNFGDGWGAYVEIRQAEPREKPTGKFCGYEWMVSSIRQNKRIES